MLNIQASFCRYQVRSILLTLGCLVSPSLVYGSDSYDGSFLTIPLVQVGNTMYTNVKITVGSVISADGGTPKASYDTYTAATNQLTIPSVSVGNVSYTNVIITVGNLISVGGGYQTSAPTIAAGTQHTAAIKSDGSLWTWGSNRYSQLGHASADTCVVDGFAPSPASSYSCSPMPEKVGDGYRTVAAGNDFTMAIKSDGSLWVWGGNFYGQLGVIGYIFNGYTTLQVSPVQVGTDYTVVAAGATHTVALKSDGSLWSWGSNMWGQLGHASTDYCTSPAVQSQKPDCSMTPVQVGSGYTAVAAGNRITAALKSDGSLWK